MEKMLYICPVDWRWIKQRPQFLAEELCSFFRLRAAYPWLKNRRLVQPKAPTRVRLSPYFTLPYLGGRIPGIGRVNEWLIRCQLRGKLRRSGAKILWITMPGQWEAIGPVFDGTVVYDCMDDYPAIELREENRAAVSAQEEKLVRRADVIFVSSGNLHRLLRERYGVPEEKLVLLRNGYSAIWPLPEPVRRGENEPLRIGYFGTIGRWFDFPLLLKSLERYPQLEYHLYGPAEKGVAIPQAERLIVHGVVAHDDIPRHAAKLHTLMMPFVLNDIVRSVDPVKLYEYICLSRSILCVEYPEIRRFEPFVSFYGDEESFLRQIEALLADASPRYTREEAAAFLKENTWTCRAQTAREAMIHRAEEP